MTTSRERHLQRLRKLLQLKKLSAEVIRPGDDIRRNRDGKLGEVMQIMNTTLLVLWEGEWDSRVVQYGSVTKVNGGCHA